METAIFQPFKKNALSLFRTSARKPTKTRLSVKKNLKADCNLLAELYFACQNCDGNLVEFFRHENQSIPPSLSQDGHIRLGTKFDIAPILDSMVEESCQFSSTCDAIIYDGAAMVNIPQPTAYRTFRQYAT